MLDACLLPVSSDRAVLRVMRPEDASSYASGTADPEVREFAHLPEPVYTEASVLTLIEGEIREGMERGDPFVLTAADPDTDAFAGSVVLFGAGGESVEVGFWVHPDHRGKGVATAALSLAVQFARHCGFTRLTARTARENDASGRVLERSGFAQVAASRGTAPSGLEVDLLHYVRDLTPSRQAPTGSR